MVDKFFDDIKIGDKIVTKTRAVTKKEIIEFAEKFDPQPMHLTEEGGESSLFGQLVGSGWHTASLTMRLIVDEKPFGNTPLIGMKIEHMQLFKPMLPNSIIYATAEVKEKRPSNSKPHIGYVNIEVKTFLEDKSIMGVQQWLAVVPKNG